MGRNTATSVSPRRLRAYERQLKALELRKAHKSYVEIAKELGYSDHKGAWEAVQAALKWTIREPAEEVKRLELERIDKLGAGLWERAERGEEGAVRTCLALMQHKAKLLGIESPVQVEDVTKRYDTGNAPDDV